MTKDDLIQENIELKSRLDFAEKWIRREIQWSISKIRKEQAKKNARIAINNIFEQEWLDILTKRILDQFDSSLDNAPKYTLERLIDAEIYWNTLQKYPHMDALPIILAYQKIFDAWIEEKLIIPFRIAQKNIQYSHQNLSLDIDIQNITLKKYTLSIWRFYQILNIFREWKEIIWNVWMIISFWKESFPNTFEVLVSEEFFSEFTELMDRELFTRKRHESKVTYSDAQKIREIMIDETSRKSFLEMIFSR